jgi:hypothetical protein
MNIVDTEVPPQFQFPKPQKEKWSEYLKRLEIYSLNFTGQKLTKQEFDILFNYKTEKYMNRSLRRMYDNCSQRNLYVPSLTKLVGDCLFESLVYNGIGDNVINLRKGVACILYIFGDYKNFFPGNEMTLKEMFTPFNDVKYVSRTNKNIAWEERDHKKYTYDVMCQDLCTMGSWSRLPTQLILMVISFLHKVEIEVINDYNHGWTPTVNVWEDVENQEVQKIYIGHLGESHYVPIGVLGSDEEIDPIYYNKSGKKFSHWMKLMEFKAYQMYQQIEEQKRKLETDKIRENSLEQCENPSGDDSKEENDDIFKTFNSELSNTHDQVYFA